MVSKHAVKPGSQDLLENVGIWNEQQLRNIQRTAINMQLWCADSFTHPKFTHPFV